MRQPAGAIDANHTNQPLAPVYPYIQMCTSTPATANPYAVTPSPHAHALIMFVQLWHVCFLKPHMQRIIACLLPMPHRLLQ